MQDFSILSKYSLNAKTVKKLLIDLDMRPIDLARRLEGISQQTISRYINGQGRNPKIQQAIADVLGVHLEFLLDSADQRDESRAA